MTDDVEKGAGVCSGGPEMSTDGKELLLKWQFWLKRSRPLIRSSYSLECVATASLLFVGENGAEDATIDRSE